MWVLFAQLVLALDACHQTSASASGGKKGVVILHRDIKPEVCISCNWRDNHASTITHLYERRMCFLTMATR